MNKNRIFFYFLSFLEGAGVMSAELLGAKMLAPYFGTSLFVWSAVLAVTLGGLACGYFAGGYLSLKKNAERNLYIVLSCSAVFLILMPFFARLVMVHSAHFDLLPAITLSSFIFLFPPVFFMGMVSPIIVRCITADVLNTGKEAGTVYAISTVGGILSTFLLGFWLIPEFGLTRPAVFIGIGLGTIPCIKLIRMKFFLPAVFLPLIAGAALFFLNSGSVAGAGAQMKIIYSAEGILGQLIVADSPIYEDGKKTDGVERILLVNRSAQTIMTMRRGKREFFDYVSFMDSSVGSSPAERHALVLGLGGGSVATLLAARNFRVDAVDLDSRMPGIAKKYFGMPGNVKVYIDDARHFVRGLSPAGLSASGYDAIVLDVFVGEVNPHHLFTREFFSELRPLLSEGGKIFVNGNGYWNGATGKGMRSVCKTLLHSGFDVDIAPTAFKEDFRTLVFTATVISADREVGEVTSGQLSNLNLNDAEILTDERPMLEKLNASANERWRKASIRYFLSNYYAKNDLLLFR